MYFHDDGYGGEWRDETPDDPEDYEPDYYGDWDDPEDYEPDYYGDWDDPEYPPPTRGERVKDFLKTMRRRITRIFSSANNDDIPF